MQGIFVDATVCVFKVACLVAVCEDTNCGVNRKCLAYARHFLLLKDLIWCS